MFVRTLKKQALQTAGTALLAITFVDILLTYPAAVATGISRGLSVCSSVIIPTLYPFMLLAGWLADSPLCRRPGCWSTAITHRLFGLPGCCGPAILLSLVGGYPAGALAIARLREQGLVDDRQIRRMTAFCVGGGPGFIINTVGAGLLGSTKAGVLLYAAHAAVSVGIGLFLGREHRREPHTIQPAFAPPRPAALIVGDTCRSLLTMCGFVLLASTLLSLWEAGGLASGIAGWFGWQAAHLSATLAALLEVSCGCIALAGNHPFAPLWLSLCLSWGGLSVQGQLAAALSNYPLLTPSFHGWRLLHGVLSGGLSLLLFRLFPVTLSTGTLSSPTVLPFSVSVAASFMLLFLSFLAMLCFCEKKTGKTE